MSYVGKILVIVQVVLSLLFMTFAIAVYNMHANWQAKFTASQDQLKLAQTAASNAQTQLAEARTQFEAQLNEEIGKKKEAEAKYITQNNDWAARGQRINELENLRTLQEGVAVSKAGEAGFRQEEAERLRVALGQLQATVDTQAAEIRKKADEFFALEGRHLALNRLYEASINQMAFLKELVAKHKLNTDPELTKDLKMPPPPVDGLVTQVQTTRSNRVFRISISVGSDDGLKLGDELSAYRAVGVNSAEWLGTIKIVNIAPDNAVAEVVLSAKNGIIQEGDNVTTRI